MAEGKNYYQILGVDPFITQKDLKIHFRKIIKLYHPDLHQGEGFETLYREILEAYDVLSDPARRFDYDHTYNFENKSPLYGSSSSYTYGAPSTYTSQGRYSQHKAAAPSQPQKADIRDSSEYWQKIREERKNNSTGKRRPQQSSFLNSWISWIAILFCVCAALWIFFRRG